MRNTLLRLALVYAAIFAAALVTLVVIVYGFTSRFIDAEVDRTIEADVGTLLEAYQRGGTGQLAREVDLRQRAWPRANGVHLLVDQDDTVLAGNLSAWPAMDEVARGWVSFEIATTDGTTEVTHPVRALVLPLPPGVRLLVGTDLSERQRLTRLFAIATGIGVVLVTLLALAIGYRQNQRIVRRVADVNRSCADILAGNFSRRLPLTGQDDEFESLARKVNELLDRLARTTEILRASLHSAAHDLRSPMHRMRLRLEQTLVTGDVRDESEVLIRDLEHMQRVLTSLLQIAEAESGSLGARPVVVPLDELLRELGELYQPQADDQQVELRLAIDPGERVRGHRQLLAQAIANLIDNALKFTPPGGRVCISSRAAEGRVVIGVADGGPGISPADRARAVEPFVRLENSTMSGGTGLGLSLVAAVARLHGGSLRLHDNAPGLLAELELPLAEAV